LTFVILVADKVDRLEACKTLLPPEADAQQQAAVAAPGAQREAAVAPDAKQEAVTELDAQQEVAEEKQDAQQAAAAPVALQQQVAAEEGANVQQEGAELDAQQVAPQPGTRRPDPWVESAETAVRPYSPELSA
jgi:hypothetical protein